MSSGKKNANTWKYNSNAAFIRSSPMNITNIFTNGDKEFFICIIYICQESFQYIYLFHVLESFPPNISRLL